MIGHSSLSALYAKPEAILPVGKCSRILCPPPKLCFCTIHYNKIVMGYGAKPHVKKPPLTFAAQHGRAFAR